MLMGANGEKCCGNDVYCRDCPELSKILGKEVDTAGDVAQNLTKSQTTSDKAKSPNNSPFDTNEGNSLWHSTN